MQDKHHVVRVDDDEVNQMVNISIKSECWSKRSIYRIPPSVTELNKRAYKPQIVSFGPYHHGLEHLIPMEEHKHRALGHFLSRVNRTLENLVRALTPFVQDLKDSYDQLDPRWIQDDDAFLKMMILDGCFILEMLGTTLPSDRPCGSVGWDYARNDPVFSKHGKLYIVPYLRRDMLMLENQIPMMVLEKLFFILYNNLPETYAYLQRLILNFFSERDIGSLLEYKHLHILDFYRNCLLLEEPRAHTREPSSKGSWMIGIDKIIYSAMELNESGICIEKSRRRSLKSITFSRGVLTLPLIVVDDFLEFLCLNMIAYERFHVDTGNEVTSYIYFMHSIIDNVRDVSLLDGCKIIQNKLGGDQAVVNLFKSLSKDLTLDLDSPVYSVLSKVNKYCEKPWPRWRARVCHTYFKSPWASISFVASILLFALICIQTFYTVLPYFRPNSSSKI